MPHGYGGGQAKPGESEEAIQYYCMKIGLLNGDGALEDSTSRFEHVEAI